MKSNKVAAMLPSDYLELVEAVYKDATTKCIADVSDLRDLMTIRSRVENEGLSFLTITLPQFCRDFERSLANRVIDSTLFKGFRLVKGGSIPAFLQGMISQIFNRETGGLFDESNLPTGRLPSDISTVIESVRQICLTFKKVEINCTPERIQKTLSSFTEIERSFDTFSVPEEELAKFRLVSSVLWGNMVVDFNTTTCIPKHGPGATAERISGNQKFVWQRWHNRLEHYFPLVDNGYPLGIPVDAEELKNVAIVPELEEQPVRVISVPKTMKGPRTIAIEPCCMQYAQQGIRDYLYRCLESYWLTIGHLNFSDQTINQKLAVESSLTGQLATIDLSDASDRVPLTLALEMFRSSPDLSGAILSCRSTRAQMPDGVIVDPLRKFASMGSALCFPIEAMYFYTVCVVALLEDRKLSCTLRNVYDVTRVLYVYGDDLLVPCANANAVLDHLRKYNCKVNSDKTFLSGSFRESCGIDAYAGWPVTPVYLRQERPRNRQQASQIISWVATGNLFYKKGYWLTAQLIFNKVEQIVGPMPYVSETSGVLGRFSVLGHETRLLDDIEFTERQKEGFIPPAASKLRVQPLVDKVPAVRQALIRTDGCRVRWNHDLQRLEVRAYVPEPVYRTDMLEGYGALTKSFLGMLRKPGIALIYDLQQIWFKATTDLLAFSVDGSELEQSARHGAVTLKRRWVTTT